MDAVLVKNKMIEALKTLTDHRLITKSSGSISMKADNGAFIVTPKDIEFCMLHPDMMMTVKSDALTDGSIDPAVETNLHALVYQYKKNAGAVIHTHQEFASVLSACGLNRAKLETKHPLLGDEINITGDAKPGTGAWIRELSRALKHSESKALVIRNHGALCFDSDAESAAKVALALEKEARDFLNQTYMKRFQTKKYSELEMYGSVLIVCTGRQVNIAYGSFKQIFNCSRNRQGFNLFNDEQRIKVAFDHTSKNIPKKPRCTTRS